MRNKSQTEIFNNGRNKSNFPAITDCLSQEIDFAKRVTLLFNRSAHQADDDVFRKTDSFVAHE